MRPYKIMDAALEMGINFFDTANVYGGRPNTGRTEEIIGRWLAQGGGRRDKIVLATKVYGPMVPHPGPNESAGISAYKVRKHVEDSLLRLQTDHIDLYQVHHIDRTVTVEEFWRTFERLENDGDILYVGSSNFPGWGLAKFQMAAWQRGLIGLISEQTQYNLLNRMPELEVLPAAQAMGIGVIPYMPLAGGLLTGKTVLHDGLAQRRCVAGVRLHGRPPAPARRLLGAMPVDRRARARRSHRMDPGPTGGRLGHRRRAPAGSPRWARSGGDAAVRRCDDGSPRRDLRHQPRPASQEPSRTRGLRLVE